MNLNLKRTLICGLLVTGCAGAQPKVPAKVQQKPVCEISGCNGELCSEKGKGMVSACVVLPRHQCLRKSRCEVQENGKCDWTKTPEYQDCIKNLGMK